MQKGIIKTFLVIILLSSFSCAKKIEPRYLLSQNPSAQSLEKKDHKICTSLKLNIDGKKDFKSSYYWHCRLSLAKYRLATGELNPMQQQQNIDINNIIKQVSLKISQSSDTFLSQEIKKIDNHHHNQCLFLGFKFDTENHVDIDEYFFCREALIKEQQLVPPFGNQEYLNYSNPEYDLNYAINSRLKKSIKIYQEQEKKYPKCVRFNVNSDNFTRCTKAEDDSRQCYSTIARKKFREEWKEKVSCQKQAYNRFGDELIKQKNKDKVDFKVSGSDFVDNSNFAMIGIDGSLFISKKQIAEMVKEEEARKKKEKVKKTNSRAGLYSKHELTKLRYKYIKSCVAASNEKLVEFEKKLKKSCEDLRLFDVLGN